MLSSYSFVAKLFCFFLQSLFKTKASLDIFFGNPVSPEKMHPNFISVKKSSKNEKMLVCFVDHLYVGVKKPNTLDIIVTCFTSCEIRVG